MIKLAEIFRKAHTKVKEATAQFEKRRASDSKAIKLLVNARVDLERAFKDKEKWAICMVRLQKLVDAWSRVVSEIKQVAELLLELFIQMTTKNNDCFIV